jgi:2-amino-4-hydroxy-6-hydroxymethyldihydropteridine diphosphokinase
VGLGSNIGDRESHIRQALRRLGRQDRIRLIASSSLYETEPVGITDQPPFLNAAAHLFTDLEPARLLEALLEVERRMGRRRTRRWGPRIIDLDLLLYEDLIVERPRLRVPHPELTRRAFVLVPLAEIAPGVVEPRSGRRVDQLLRALNSTGGVRPYPLREDHDHD